MTAPNQHVRQLLQQGKQQQAIQFLEGVLTESTDNNPQLSADLAGIYLQVGRFSEAEEHFAHALEHAPDSDQLWHLMGIAQYQAGKKSAAQTSFAKAEERDPFAKNILAAEQALEDKQEAAGITHLEGVLSKFSAHPRASFLLASISLQQGNAPKATVLLQRALGFAPFDSRLWQLQTQAMVILSDLKGAIFAAERMVEIAPDNSQYRLQLADVLQQAGKMERAQDSYYNAIDAGADHATCILQIAHIKRILGEKEEAIKLYRECLRNNEITGSAFWALNTTSSYRAGESELSLLNATQFNPDISLEQACQASFALAREKEKSGLFDEAFLQYKHANELKTDVHYNPLPAEAKFDAIKRIFAPDIFNETVDVEHEVTPIFIVGLPRSGSTLVEQILASHSEVEATMELKVMPAIARRAFLLSCQKAADDSGDIRHLNNQELTSLGQDYLKLTEVFRTGKKYFIDKLPPNFQHVGLIKKLLPHAIVINTHRHPMAWGMAVYRQYFAQGHDYSYQLEHIAHAFKNYVSLMDHWRTCSGIGLHDVSYEALVSDPASHIRQMLAFCELKFEQACLTPHLTERYVNTASRDQVRQPIYQSAIDSWEKYSSHLEPLRQALSD